MNDARLGIVRLPLPDGRAVPLQLTYRALDAHGHDWLLEQFKIVQKGRAGSSTALGELLDLMSAGEIKAADVEAAPMAAYPLATCLKALWATWDLAQYGPQGRQADDGGENPPRSARPTWSRRIFGRLFGRG